MPSIAYEIPSAPFPQRMTIALAGVEYVLVRTWCEPNSSWILDVYSVDGTAILLGTPLVCGLDLLEQFKYLLLGGGMIAQTDHAPNNPPTFENMGSAGHLYFVSPKVEFAVAASPNTALLTELAEIIYTEIGTPIYTG